MYVANNHHNKRPMQIRLTEKKDCMYRIDISVMSWLLFSDWYTKIIVTVLELVYLRIFHFFVFFLFFCRLMKIELLRNPILTCMIFFNPWFQIKFYPSLHVLWVKNIEKGKWMAFLWCIEDSNRLVTQIPSELDLLIVDCTETTAAYRKATVSFT